MLGKPMIREANIMNYDMSAEINTMALTLEKETGSLKSLCKQTKY